MKFDDWFINIFYYYLPLVASLIKIFFKTALITAVVETAFFYFAKFRQKKFLWFVFWINIVTNLALNGALSLLPNKNEYFIYGEIIVFLVEFCLFSFAFGNRNKYNIKRLFTTTLTANLLTIILGLICEIYVK